MQEILETWVSPESGRLPGVVNGNPLQYSCLGNAMDRGAWQATVHGAAKIQTQLSNQRAAVAAAAGFSILKKKSSCILICIGVKKSCFHFCRCLVCTLWKKHAKFIFLNSFKNFSSLKNFLMNRFQKAVRSYLS